MTRRPLPIVLPVSLILAAALGLAGCSSDEPAPYDGDPSLVQEDGSLSFTVVLPVSSGTALTLAAGDLVVAAESVSGALGGQVSTGDVGCDTCVVVALGHEIDVQGYELVADEDGGIRVLASTEVGAMYGLYDIAARLGARYYHPVETHFVPNAEVTLPDVGLGSFELPAFELRGFHEHTQHPIVMSDFYLRPNDGYRAEVSDYIRWMARNRQNAISWHMLKSVDLEAWLPYIEDIINEAHDWGINVGMVMSFVDQQQNNFKILDEASTDDEATQITNVLDRFVERGFDFFTFQIGSSEFTKPDDQEVLDWLQIVADGFADQVDLFAWIHTTCDLESDDGGYFFHLPGQADERIGSWAHTTMFYDLEHPAPVYGCETFNQQRDFMVEEQGERDLVYFPETAWWLGFDNNLPLAMPVTGWTRGNDINNQLTDLDVRGHITFTSGREWGYWQYDHYLQRATWDADLTWAGYLDWIAPMFGDNGELLVSALNDWTALQVDHFLGDDPLMYFYLAGELRQDEIGAQAGILARRPKIAFSEVFAYDDVEFAAWQPDLTRLETMLGQYTAIFETLPAPNQGGTTESDTLYAETYDTLQLYVWRIEHTIALYSGVVAAREWRLESAQDEPDESVRSSSLDAATSYLETAQAITVDVLEAVARGEARYRYGVDILAREKPDSLTSYPFGYLYETSTAHFWDRRDRQLENLIGVAFDTIVEEWTVQPDLILTTDGDNMTLISPDNELAGSALTGFIPQMLVALTGLDGANAPTGVAMAEDFNQNLIPDGTTEIQFSGERTGDTWAGNAAEFPLVAYNGAGERFGEVTLVEPAITLDLVASGDPIAAVVAGTLDAGVISNELIALVMDFAGIDEDGVANLLKGVFEIPSDEPLPAILPIRFALEFVTQ